MTYVIAFGLVLFGFSFGAVVEHLLIGISNDELATHCYRLEIENERLKEGRP